MCNFAPTSTDTIHHMLEYIKGDIVTLSPTAAVVETVAGLAYRLNISIATYSAIEGSSKVRLFVHEQIRDDAGTLFGFSTEEERELFRSLVGVSGVGAATAIIILSSLQGDELTSVISSADVKRLTNIKGIGKKTAERIIVDLRDKIKAPSDTLLLHTEVNAACDEALSALLMLGFDKKQSEKALAQIFSENPGAKVEVAIKKALAIL